VSRPRSVDDVGEEPDPVTLPIDGTLDLHTFDPAEVDDLIRDYLDACRERGILQARIVHGKGRGVLKARVESILDRLPDVVSRRAAGEDAGGWGATLVTLHPVIG
jgi:DNA-nicking Smr family endonuclease